MHDRSLLGLADVTDVELTAMVARQLDTDGPDTDGPDPDGPDTEGGVELLESTAAVVPYDLEALTTAGRYRVRGRARTQSGDRSFSFFVKVVQSWGRSRQFANVPPENREMALASLPWQVEPMVYRSDLATRLPPGLRMPTAYEVRDLDGESAALWLQDVDLVVETWSTQRFAQAARLLGRLAASPDVRPLAGVGRTGTHGTVRGYAEGRVAHQLLPALRSDDLWSHPLVAAAFDDDLRARLLRAADDLPAIVEELEAMPLGTSHGDACSRNLLIDRCSQDLVLIDYGFWGERAIGFDLSQLLVGEVQVGERPASSLPGLEQTCLEAYVTGLRQEGCDVTIDAVRRAHALVMLVFSGLSAIPFEHLSSPPTPETLRIAGERAQSARFMLELAKV